MSGVFWPGEDQYIYGVLCGLDHIVQLMRHDGDSLQNALERISASSKEEYLTVADRCAATPEGSKKDFQHDLTLYMAAVFVSAPEEHCVCDTRRFPVQKHCRLDGLDVRVVIREHSGKFRNVIPAALRDEGDMFALGVAFAPRKGVAAQPGDFAAMQTRYEELVAERRTLDVYAGVFIGKQPALFCVSNADDYFD